MRHHRRLGLPDAPLGAFKQDLYEQSLKEGWTVVSMKRDWKTSFPARQSEIPAIDL